jgi:hypothetical protein
MYRTVDEHEIDAFTADFRGSEEEKNELLKYYDQFHGDMDKVWWALCCLIQGTARSSNLGQSGKLFHIL